MHFSSWISTRIMSGPILLMHSKGIMNSQSYPRSPHTFPGPGRIIASMQPVHILTRTSVTHPSLLQLQTFMTSLFLSVQNRTHSSFIFSPKKTFLYFMLLYLERQIFQTGMLSAKHSAPYPVSGFTSVNPGSCLAPFLK